MAASAGTSASTCRAVALGWAMAELYAAVVPENLKPPAVVESHQAPPTIAEVSDRPQLQADLPGLGSLRDRQKTTLLIREVESGIHEMSSVLASAGLQDVAVPPLTELVRVGGDEGRYQMAAKVLTLHTEVLVSLHAADRSIGRAYALGRALADITLRPQPADDAGLQRDFNVGRVATLTQELQDLHSVLPPHTGRAVSSSIGIWQEWTRSPRWNDAPLVWATSGAEVTALLRQQGSRWRLLLTGEKEPLDELSADDYVKAGGYLLGRANQILRSFSTRNWPWLVLTGALAIALAVLAGAALGSIEAKATGIAVSLLAGVGVTTASLRAAVRNVWRSAQEDLWQAELDLAVGRAATVLPGHAHPPVVGEA